MKHWVITLDWARDFEEGFQVLAVEHSAEDAKQKFDQEVENEREIAERNGWKVYEDNDAVFDAGEDGSHIQDHTTVRIFELDSE